MSYLTANCYYAQCPIYAHTDYFLIVHILSNDVVIIYCVHLLFFESLSEPEID